MNLLKAFGALKITGHEKTVVELVNNLLTVTPLLHSGKSLKYDSFNAK
jgi:hypothetical protein